MGLSKINTKEASDDYFSSSSIDNPPREPKAKKGKQEKLPGAEEHEEKTEEFLEENGPVKVKYSLALTIKSDSGDTVIKFGPYEAFPEQLEDHVTKQINSKYFKSRMRAAAALAEEEVADA
jgi:hypothetical protein